MKACILFSLLSLFSSLLFGADDGPHTALKATIITRHGTVIQGYFVCRDLTIEKDSAGYYYRDGPIKMRLRGTFQNGGLIIDTLDYHFVNEVKRKLFDSLEVFDDAILFQGNTEPGTILMPWLIGRPIKLHANQIAGISIHIVYNFYYGPSLLTNLTAMDKNWITDQPLYCGSFEEELCSYRAIYFSGTEQSALKKLTKLKVLFDKRVKHYNDTTAEKALRKAIEDEVEKLRAQKIIIYGYCSC